MTRPPTGPERGGRAAPPPESAADRRNPPNVVELTAKQEAVAVLLAGGATVTAAARKAKVGERTVRDWQANGPAFNDRVRALRQALTDRTLGLLATASADAVRTLADLLAAEREGTRQKAADALLTHAVRHREADAADLLDEVIARLAALEVRRKR